MFYACKDNIYISFCKYFRYKKTHICYYLTFRNKICRLFYIYFHYIYLIIYNCFVVLFLHGLPCWCVFPAGVGVFPAGGSIHSAGVSSLLMLVSSLLVVVFIRLVCLPCWCRCHRGHIRSRTPKQGHTRLLSAAAVSRPNRSFRVKTTNTIALIISYLGFDFRMYFYRTG